MMNPGKHKPPQTYGRKRRRLLPNVSSFHDSDMSSWVPSGNQLDRSQIPPALPPNKPSSQKAATMPAQPSDEDVATVVDVTSMDRATAARYLRAKQNDVSAAITAFFDGEDISKAEQATQWDENAWSAGKDGEANEYLRPLASSAAATRPNSPAPSTGGRANLNPSSKQEEDDDLARALAMSTGDLGGAYQQETGVVGASGQQTVTFGPANKPYYDENKWGMVAVGINNTSEIVPDADAEHRIHTPGEPRLLKYMPTGDYTPNLLTICHAIAGAREAMLMREHVQMSYGQDAEWWRGHAISMPKIINLEDGSAAGPESDKYDELLAEVQRIMAFLSASNRSYASVGALTQTDAIINPESSNNTPSRTLLDRFLNEWGVAASSKSGDAGDMASLFNTVVGTNAPEGLNTPDMSLVDMQVNIPEGSKSDLFEQLDDLLWDTRINDSAMSDNYIERPAEVLVMRAYQQNPTASPQLRLEVPAEFYVDKYLRENIEGTRATRTQMANGRKRIAKIEEIEKKLKTWKHPRKNEQLDAGSLLTHTYRHFSGELRTDIIAADKTSYVSDEMKENPPHYQEIAQKLEKVVTSIDNKLAVLAEEKEKTRKAIAEMSKAPPSGLQPEDLKHRYSLRGVATKPNITYVLCAANNNAVDEMLDDDSTPQGMQWWRMEYEVSGSTVKITKTKSADYDVLRAVELEHSSALLVYASDRMNQPPTTLDDTVPQPLQDFINKDNDLFASELHAERHKPPPYHDFTTSYQEAGERASLDSTRVEDGGSPTLGMGIPEIIAGESPSPPEYSLDHDDDGGFMGHHHHAFGLGPDIKQGYRVEDDEPVHEITLDDEPFVGDEGVEMMERGHGMFFGSAGNGGGVGEVVMEDAEFVEDVGRK